MKIKSFAVIVATCTILCHWDAFGCSEGSFMKEIQLTQGKVALVDDEDFEYLSQWKWCAARHGRIFYAVSRILISGKLSGIAMHRLVLGLKDRNILCDHADGNGLNNQRYNLRKADYRQNGRNRAKGDGTSSLFKGVSWCSTRKKWAVSIMASDRRIFLGYGKSEVDAAVMYNAAALKHFGEFAKLNTIE